METPHSEIVKIKWFAVRNKRDKLISETDWTQTVDSPMSAEKQAEFAAYRKILRDIPQTYNNPDDVFWPSKPTL
ncbi:phage tail assembly chaperone [Vibrio vulnificus]|nr:phage tail assembly chaperone [Vibrio vulnificus]